MLAIKASYRGHEFFVPYSVSEVKQKADDVGMHHWFKHSVNSTLTYAEQLWHINDIAFDRLRPSPKILEAFCGFGLSTAPYRDLVGESIGVDHDWQCVNAYAKANPKSSVKVGNTYTTSPDIMDKGDIDYVLLEYNSMTMYRLLRSDQEILLLDAAITNNVPLITIVDSSKVKGHLHRGTYGRWLDTEIKNDADYVSAIAAHMHREFGYGMIGCAYDSVNYTYLFELGREPRYSMFDARQAVDLSQFKQEPERVSI